MWTRAAWLSCLAIGLFATAAVAADDIASNIPPILNVPLSIHVVRDSDQNGGLSELRVNQAIVDANVAFQSMGVYFCQIGPTIYIDDDEAYFALQSSADYAGLKNIDVVPDTINIYFTGNMGCPSPDQADCPNPAICGISSYTSTATQGIVMSNSCTGVPEDRSTIAHELGHYFNLLHTQGNDPTECPDGSNCTTAGDQICDTAATPRLDLDNVDFNTCEYTGTQLTCDQAYDPDVCNHMSYAPKGCRDAFSLQQVAKARSTLIEQRPELILDPSCPYPNACSLAAGECSQEHGSPGCSDVSCCMDVCAQDLHCCAAEWDQACVYKRSLVCLDIAIPPPGDIPHAPLGLATLSIDRSTGAVLVSSRGDRDDGVVLELDVADSMDMEWDDPDPRDGLPTGASLKLSSVGWTGIPRAQPTGSSRVSKRRRGDTHFVSITADFDSPTATVQIYDGRVLIAEASVPSGRIARVPRMPSGGGIPASLYDGPRFHWQWSSAVRIKIPGQRAARGTRLEIHADADDRPRVRRFQMLALQTREIAQLAITGEQQSLASEPFNDECRDPALIVDESVSILTDSWYLYAASCNGRVTVTSGLGAPISTYTGTCDDLKRIGGSHFRAECGVPYLVHVDSLGGETASDTLTIDCAGSCVDKCAADLDSDGNVGISDLRLLAEGWGHSPGHPADFDSNGFVGFFDAFFMFSAWGGDCPDLF